MAKKTFLKGILAAVAAVFMVGAIAGCSSEKYELAAETNDDGSMTVTAENCAEDGMFMSSVTVPEGMTGLKISGTDVQGTLHIRIGNPLDLGEDASVEDLENAVDASGEDYIMSCDATGTFEQSGTFEPGDYSLTVYGDDAAPATGTVLITPVA